MKKFVISCVIAFLISHAECGRKVLQPLNKNANLDFIKMEGGGLVQPGNKAGAPVPNSPLNSNAAKPGTPPQSPTPSIVKPASPVIQPLNAPVSPVKTPVQPVITPAQPAKPVQQPQPATTLKPVQSATPPKPVQSATTKPNQHTPLGPSNVQQLINYYDSKGQHSLIRPHSYSQAVKQG